MSKPPLINTTKLEHDLKRAQELATWLETLTDIDRLNVTCLLENRSMVDKLPDGEFSRNIRDLIKFAEEPVPEDHYDLKIQPIETRMVNYNWKPKKDVD